MELLRGTAPKVRFYGPTPDTEIDVVTYSVNGVEPIVGTFAPVDGEDNAYEVQLPYLRSDVNDVEVVWHFDITGVTESFEEVFSYEVVTPYLTLPEVRVIHRDVTDAEYLELEASVRHAINAHTGQKFGYDKNKTLTVEGHGERALRLPERLVELTGLATLTAHLNPLTAIIVSDGWYLKKGWTENVTARESTNAYFGANSVNMDILPGEPGYEKPGHGHIITVPGSARPSVWKDDYPFEITGNWGYKHIPSKVKEAAKLLTNDYACAEAAYRDKYLKSLRAADWRMEFSSRSWESTGNVRADQLLSEYVIMEWAVV